MPDLHFIHVIGRDQIEAKESDFYNDLTEAQLSAHFMTEMKREQRDPKKNVGYDYNVYTVPIDIHWDQMFCEGDNDNAD